jgi:hypothetical protein
VAFVRDPAAEQKFTALEQLHFPRAAGLGVVA